MRKVLKRHKWIILSMILLSAALLFIVVKDLRERHIIEDFSQKVKNMDLIYAADDSAPPLRFVIHHIR